MLLTVSLVSTATAQVGVPFFRNFPSSEYGAQRKNYDIVFDKRCYVFVANMEGILCFDFEHWTTIHLPNYERVIALHIDEEGKLWFKGIESTGYVNVNENGTLSAVIAPADENMFVSHTRLIAENSDVIEAINGQGLRIYNSKSEEDTNITTINGLCSNNINGICIDNIGNIWGATDNGVFVLKYPTAYGKFTPDEGLHGEVKSIVEYKDFIYVGTNQGLFKVNSNSTVQRIEGVIGCHQMKLYEDKLLIAAANGLLLYDGKNIKQISPLFVIGVEVQDKNFRCICQDGVWQIDQNGIAKMTEPVTPKMLFETQFQLQEGWKTDGKEQNLYHMGGDEAENERWLGPYKHLFVTALHADDKTLWVGTDTGLYTADRDYMNYTITMKAPTMRFCRISYLVDSINVVWGGFPDYVQDDEITLPHDVRFIRASYATKRIGCITPSLYSTKIDETVWKAWTEDAEFLMNNPKYGHHTITVKTKNAYGMESEPISLKFYVEYPWYLKWYAIVIYIVLLVFTTHHIVAWRTKKLKDMSDTLEKMVDERTAELKNIQKELVRSERMATVGKLTQGLIDRILNPMNYINNFSKLNIDLLKDLMENVEEVKDKVGEDIFDDCSDLIDMLDKNLLKISDHGLNTSRILKDMEEVLKEPKLNICEHDLSKEIIPIIESAKSVYAKDIEALSMNIEFKEPGKPVIAYCDIRAISNVIHRLIINSIYAIHKRFEKDNTPGIISVELSNYDNSTFITIQDNGIGIEEAIIDKVFDPFFTTKTTSEASGVGLYICKNIISMMNGDIVVASEKNKFTEFKIILWQN